MFKDNSFLEKRIGEFIGLLVISIIILQAPFIDILILKNSIGEISLTEITQEFLLGIIVCLFIYNSFRYPKIKYGMILIAGFFSCLLIRELDFIMDKIAFSWFYIVMTIALFCIIIAVKHKENILYGLNHFCKSESYYIMVCGLLMILAFSRLIGMRILWENLLGKSYIRVVKNAIEEISELMCYTLCLVAALKYTGSLRKCHL
jgi:hypothetical protein